MRPAAPTLCLLLPLLLVTRAVPAQPADAKRVLRTFDFEERRLGNSEELPMHWAKVEGPGMPHYVNARLAGDSPRTGAYSFRFDLNGGSLVYRYGPDRVRVRRGAHYRVEGYCRTTVLRNARARLTAYCTDVDGHLLPDTVRHSEPYAAATPGETGAWKRLGVDLSAESPNAAFLVIELGLLQPSVYAGHTLGTRTLHTQDVRGSAWFDDVTVAQVPRVTVRTNRPGNLFRRNEPLRLEVLVNDRFTDDLSARVVVRDALGTVVYQRTEAPKMSATAEEPSRTETAKPQSADSRSQIQPTLSPTPAPGVQRTTTIDLPDLPPGWYEASVSMSSQGQHVGGQTLRLIHLADGDAPGGARPSNTPDPRFGIVATDLPFAGWEKLPEILPMLSAGRVKLAVWSAAGDVEQMDPAKFDRLVERLQSLGITPTAVLADPPPALAAKLGGADWAQLLKTSTEDWQPQLAYLISRHANHLDRWQLGLDGSDAFVSRPEMRRVYAAVYKEFAALVRKPDLAMPWPAWYELEGELPATVALSVPPTVLPSQLPLYVNDLRGQKAHELSLSLQLLDRERYGREVQIRDLAERVIYALSAGAERIDLPLPFTVSQAEDGSVVEEPQELLMVLRTLTATLSGAKFRGKVPLADGVEAFLFDRHGQGILAVWDRAGGAGGDVRQLTLNLGQRPVSVDLWGNVTPLYRTAEERQDGKVRLSLTATPIFLVDVDGEMSQLRASVALDRPLLESSFEPHTRKFRFTNPYRQTIGGAVRLTAPPGWRLNPPTFNFTLNPGETFDRDLCIEFPYNSFAGAKTLVAEFALQGDGSPPFAVPITLNLGLSDVGTQTLALRDGNDVIVQQMISNYGDRPIDYTAFAIYPGQARQERLVSGLAPGRTTVKKYRFKGVDFSPNAKVRVGIKEMSGTRVLNDEVEIR